MTGLDVEAVLRDHADWEQRYDDERSTVDAALWRTVCSCGELLPRGGFSDDAHRAHVAAVLRVEIDSALGDAWDAGLDAGLREPSPSESLELPPNPYRPPLAATEGDRQ